MSEKKENQESSSSFSLDIASYIPDLGIIAALNSAYAEASLQTNCLCEAYSRLQEDTATKYTGIAKRRKTEERDSVEFFGWLSLGLNDWKAEIKQNHIVPVNQYARIGATGFLALLAFRCSPLFEETLNMCSW